MKTVLKNREEIIAAIEGEDFLKIPEFPKVSILVDKGTPQKKTLTGTPFIEVEAKGRTFGVEVEGYGKIEIYSHKFNNLTNAAILMVAFR